MKIYFVCAIDWEDCHHDSIWSSREKADARAAELQAKVPPALHDSDPLHWGVEEYTLDEVDDSQSSRCWQDTAAGSVGKMEC